MPDAFLQFEFLRHALWAGLLVSIACGVIGSLVVVNRLVFLSGGIAHAAFGGVGVAYYLGLPPLACTSVFSVLAALGMGGVKLLSKSRPDTLIGAIAPDAAMLQYTPIQFFTIIAVIQFIFTAVHKAE